MRGIAWLVYSGVIVSLDVDWIDGSAGDWYVHTMRRVHLKCRNGRVLSTGTRHKTGAPESGSEIIAGHQLRIEK